MSKRKEKFYNDPWDRDFYETGSVRPPKDRGGLVAVLLVAVILLGGICSALGIVNIRLLQKIAEGDRSPDTVYLFEEDDTGKEVTASTDPLSHDRMPQLGLQGQTVSDFDRRYYKLPQGVLVTDVAEERSAHLAGIRAGDVIISLAGSSISSQEELTQALDAYGPGETVQVEIYRSQTQEKLRITVQISEEKKE